MLKLLYARLLLLKRFQHLPYIYYFKFHLRTRIKHITRNDDVGDLPSRVNLSILLKRFQHLPHITLNFT